MSISIYTLCVHYIDNLYPYMYNIFALMLEICILEGML